MPFKCSVAHQLLLKFTKSLTVFEQHCPQYDLNVLVQWLSFFEQLSPQFTDSSFDHLCPQLIWISFLWSNVLPPGCSIFQGVSISVYVISVKDFANSIDVLLVRQSFLFWNQLSHFKDHVYSSLICWNEIREMSILESIFENKFLCSKT
jgi:hypothetical protein